MPNKRVVLRAISAVVIVASLVLVTASFSTCAGPQSPRGTGGSPSEAARDATSPAERQAEALMVRYSLHPVGPPHRFEEQLGGPGGQDFVIIGGASKAIGLDITRYAGKKLQWLSYLLAERSQAREGTTHAFFLVDGQDVVGAFLSLAPEYIPGPVPLYDRSEFMPPGLAPDRLVFENVRAVDVVGPRSGPEKKRRLVTLRDAASVEQFLGLLAASKPRRGDRFSYGGDEEYLLTIRYRTPQNIRVALSTPPGRGAGFVVFHVGPFWDWYYIPPAELRAYLDTVLAKR